MNRREFSWSTLGAFGALVFHRVLWPSNSGVAPRVNGERLMEHLRALGEIGKNPQGGVSRLAYSEADREGRQYVMGLMHDAQLDTNIDAAGNIIGRRTGSDPDLPPLMFGSHIDSVPQGGNYDGPLGSLAAVEAARTLAENNLTTRHPLEVIVFQNEEGGKTGSRAISGEVREAELDLITHSGKTIRQGIEFIEGDPTKLHAVRRQHGDIAAYLELHVEQGGILESRQIDIGVVEGIVGIKRWNVTVDGFANHAGTTPMDGRQDALLAAARFIEAVNHVVVAVPGRQVGTVGRIQALPGAPNVIPGHVMLSLELRDLDMAKIEMLYQEIRAESFQISTQSGTRFSFDEFYVSRAAPTDERLWQIIADSAAELGLSMLRMPSGAGHDAQSIARLAPVGMIFIPSVEGISHSPREFSRPADIVSGANVLLHALLRADTAALDW